MAAGNLKQLMRVCDVGARTYVMSKLRFPVTQIRHFLTHNVPSLGPVYVKVAQFMSMRPDIFGEDLAECMLSMRDKVPPMSRAEVDEMLHRAGIMSDVERFDYDPIASASIGQVHRARLKVGEVAVKIKRLNIEASIDQDIAHLSAIFKFLGAVNPPRRPEFDKMVEWLQDAKSAMLNECDFVQEAANMRYFRKMYHIEGLLVVPSLWQWSPDTIVMEYVGSGKLHDHVGDKALAYTIMSTFIMQVIHTGVIHGDPHAGNMGISDQGEIVLYDFGNVIVIPKPMRRYLKEVVLYVMLNNKNGVVSVLKQMGAQVTNETALKALLEVYRDYIKTVDFNQLSAAMSDSMDDQDNGAPPIILPKEILSLLRVFGILEGVCKSIDASFNYTKISVTCLSSMVLDDDFWSYKSMRDTREMINFMRPLDDN